MSHRPRTNQRGFTIIELLIATVIFSVILLVVTAGVMRFTRQYYKGAISSTTQNTARAIIDDVTRAVQFNSGAVYTLTTNQASVPPNFNPGAPIYGYCVGESRRYSFVRDRQVTQDGALGPLQSRFGLVSDNVSGCNGTTRAVKTDTLSAINQLNDGTPLTNSRELLGNHMRLSKFRIDSEPDGVYSITVKVIYGDNDLLCSPSIPQASPGGCNPDAPDGGTVLAGRDDLRCRLAAGAQFCAVSELSTTVKKRVY